MIQLQLNFHRHVCRKTDDINLTKINKTKNLKKFNK